MGGQNGSSQENQRQQGHSHKSMMVICSHCDTKFEVRDQARIAKCAHLFCSQTCYHAWRHGRKRFVRCRGVNLVDLVCEMCSAPFSVKKYRAQTARFCSIKCMAKWRGDMMRKPEQPARARRTRARIRRKLIEERGNRCEFCKCEDKHLHVHHVKRLAEFPQYGKSILNLRLLCPDCHAAQHPDQAAAILAAYRG